MLISVNVNGFTKKHLQVEDLARKEKVLIMVMQETLVMMRHYLVVLKGYRTFAKPWEKKFRGQAVLVDDRLSVYKVQHDNHNHILYLKVSGMLGCEKPVHVLSVYLPSGGTFRGERTQMIAAMGQLTEMILRDDSGMVIVGMGDFNTETGSLDKKLRMSCDGIRRIVGVGSMLSRFPTNKLMAPKELDHFVGSQNVTLLFKKARVLRKYPISDH